MVDFEKLSLQFLPNSKLKKNNIEFVNTIFSFCKYSNELLNNYVELYDQNKTYYSGDFIQYEFKKYISLKNENVGNLPTITSWSLIDDFVYLPYYFQNSLGLLEFLLYNNFKSRCFYDGIFSTNNTIRIVPNNSDYNYLVFFVGENLGSNIENLNLQDYPIDNAKRIINSNIIPNSITINPSPEFVGPSLGQLKYYLNTLKINI